MHTPDRLGKRRVDHVGVELRLGDVVRKIRVGFGWVRKDYCFVLGGLGRGHAYEAVERRLDVHIQKVEIRTYRCR